MTFHNPALARIVPDGGQAETRKNRRYDAALRTGSLNDRQRQLVRFNRSLGQITDDWRCAELYYLRNGKYVTNPHVPLQ